MKFTTPLPQGHPIGGPAWRRSRGLQTVGDMVEDYLAIRRPRGAYRVPIPEDLLPSWREVA